MGASGLEDGRPRFSVVHLQRASLDTWLHLAQWQWAQWLKMEAFFTAELLGERIQIFF